MNSFYEVMFFLERQILNRRMCNIVHSDPCYEVPCGIRQGPKESKHVITYRILIEGRTVLETRLFTERARQLAMHPRLTKH